MGCPAECEIGDNLVFSICTHDPDTGVLTDTAVDDLPTYRIYEDETATAILNGSMSKLDGSNTTGFYTELIEVTAANGFEAGKTYTIYIEATVDSDTGGIAYSFKVPNTWYKAITESYSTNGQAATPAQLLYQTWSLLNNHLISDETWTTYMLDTSTTAMTFEIQLDVDGNPVGLKRLT